MKRPLPPVLPPALRPTTDRRAGVALVIALGLLSLMLITGVAFTIMMRVERAGAANLRHVTAARQLARGGVAYAIAAINDDIGSRAETGWTNRPLQTASGRRQQTRLNGANVDVHLPDDIFLSLNEKEDNPRSVAYARVLTAGSARYLPGALRHRAEMIFKDGTEYARPEWIPVRGMGSTLGRYAFAVLDTSGLLDANVVNDPATNRWMGGTPAEIRLDPNVQLDVKNVAQFVNSRSAYGRYETLPELAMQNAGLDGDALQNFGVFSYSLPERMPLDPPAGASPAMKLAHDALVTQLGGNKAKKIQAPKIDISTEARIKSQQEVIELAFKASGLSATQARWAYLGLLDYVDADNNVPVPAGAPAERLARPATEAMPLFSTVIARVKYEYSLDPVKDEDGTEYAFHQLKFFFNPVFSYPFQTAASGFKLETRIVFGLEPPMAGLPAGMEVLFPPVLQTVEPSKSGVAAGPGLPSVIWLDNGLDGLSIPATRVRLPKSAGKLPFGWKLHLQASARTRNEAGTIIRQLPADDYTGGAMVEMHALMSETEMTKAETGADGAFFWSEALDPRYAWEGGPAFWRASQDSEWATTDGNEATAPLSELALNPKLHGYSLPDDGMVGSEPINSLAKHMVAVPATLRDYFKIVTDGVRLGGAWDLLHADPWHLQLRAHVKDRPLESVGELGYLPIGAFLTINLLDHQHETPADFPHDYYPNNTLPALGYHPVLDYFTLTPPDKGRAGLVSLNTINPEAMGAIFTQMPLRTERFLSDTGTIKPIPAVNSGSFDDALELAEWVIERGPYRRLSDLATLFQDAPQIGVPIGTFNYGGQDPVQLLQRVAQPDGFGEFEREALIRNTCNLFSLRGQMFTIILRADSFAPTFGMTGVKQGNVLATAATVAQVWRDTVPMMTEARNAAGQLVQTYNYPSFIQFFKILNE